MVPMVGLSGAAYQEIEAAYELASAKKAKSLLRVDESGVGVIQIQGPIMRDEFEAWWWGGTSTEALTRAVNEARESQDVKTLFLDIDSPGGETGGLEIAADAIRETRDVKPVIAQSNGMMCSAAYWLGAQASVVLSGSTDWVGSIGVRLMLYDFEERFRQLGVKAIPIDTGGMKSAGATGTVVTDSQQAYFKELVDQAGQEFVSAIAVGRGVSHAVAQSWLQGRIWTPPVALSMGLIDGISTSADTLRGLRSGEFGKKGIALRGRAKLKGEVSMSEEKTPTGEAPVNAPREGAEQEAPKVEAASPAPVNAPVVQAPDPVLVERERVQRITMLGTDYNLPNLAGALVKEGVSLSEAIVRMNQAKQDSLKDRGQAKVGPSDAGEGEKPKPAANTEEGWKAEYAASPDLQAEFMSAEGYAAFRRGVENGSLVFTTKQ